MRRLQPVVAPAAPIETGPAASWTKRVAIAAAIAAVVVAGLIWARPGLIPQTTPKVASPQTATVALRPSAPEETKPVPSPAEQQPPAPPAQTAAPAPAETSAQTQTKVATSAAPDKAAPQPQPSSQSPTTATPVPGSYYKVMRGDMLSQIALTAYRDASKYSIIARANPNPSLWAGSDSGRSGDLRSPRPWERRIVPSAVVRKTSAGDRPVDAADLLARA